MKKWLPLIALFATACPTVGGRPGGSGVTSSGPDTKGPAPSTKPRSKALVAMVAGRDHTCALRESGHVSCWGVGRRGQLGNGKFSDSRSPVEVAGLDDAVALSAGDDHTCARREDGSVHCWGDNDRGQLGNERGRAGAKSALPVPVKALADVVEVRSGARHACARRESGSVVCWGDNGDGQLGNRGRPFWPAPVALPSLADASSLAAGRGHTCALRTGGKAICWGANGHGQLGDGGTRGHERPSPVKGLAGATTISAGGDTTCAAGAFGVRCWGRDGSGAADRPIPAPVAGLDNAREVVVGPDHVCALDGAGRSRCWGANHDGRLGDGTRDPRSSPVGPKGLGSVVAVAVGHRHTCAALRDAGRVMCWGDASSGATGTEGSDPPKPGAPTRAFDIDDAIAMDAGSDFSCAALKNGETRCWGAGHLGQLGHGKTPENQSEPVVVANVEHAVDIATGTAHACAALRNGQVMCWGQNDAEQVAPGGRKQFATPAKVPGISDAVAVAAGAKHSCAARKNGQVKCWGSDEFEQLGDGAGKRGGNVAALVDATQLSAGDHHTCARRRSGAISCWGSNSGGQLGNSAGAAELKTARATPVGVTRIADAAEVSAGRNHTCARSIGGKAACWGLNDKAQLGSGTLSTIWTSRVPVKNVVGASALGVGFDHACVSAGGRVSCWGSAGLALGAGARDKEPILRPGPKLDAIEIAAGERHTCARLRSGAVTCWGDNDVGQLGDGSRLYVTSPAPVSGL